MTEPEVRRVIILGSTGSIGTQAVQVVGHLNERFLRGEFPFRVQVVGLAAGRNAALVFEQASAMGVRHVALAAATTLGAAPPGAVRVLTGHHAAERLVREVECDLVLAAMVGVAGLPATLAAVELGRDVALANKETLVAAGGLVIPAAKKSGSRLLPVDSEHAGVWQCLTSPSQHDGDWAVSAAAAPRTAGPLAPPLTCGPEVARVILTASGGPFRTWTKAAMDAATPEQALRHPTWTMGPKVTIDSASLMNKALELIEAHWLFGLEPERLAAVIHPQSVVHAMVEYADGSTVAQLGAPDMRAPIQFALAWPARAQGCARRLDWTASQTLAFQPIDGDQFPAVGLAFEAMRRGGCAGAVLNAANEAAVEAFLAGRISFGHIARLVEGAMGGLGAGTMSSLADCLTADNEARKFVELHLSHRGGGSAGEGSHG